MDADKEINQSVQHALHRQTKQRDGQQNGVEDHDRVSRSYRESFK